MLNIIAEINSYYEATSPESEEKTRSLVFVISEDVAIGEVERRRGRWGLTKVYSQTLCRNLTEFVASKIRRRKATYFQIKFIKVSFQGRCYVNFNNGTALILTDEMVDKFYFKDKRFFAEVYSCISECEDLEIHSLEDLLLVRSAWRGLPIEELGGKDLLTSVKKSLKSFATAIRKNVQSEELFSVRSKVAQLFNFRSTVGARESLPYLEIASELEVAARKYQQVPCHGDLWNGNILRNRRGEINLIDFDKSLFFSPAYDYVYYYLMSRVLPSNRSIEDVLGDMELHAKSIFDFLAVECDGDIGNFDVREIRLCIFLFSFLKLVEKDLRLERSGASIPVLRASLGRC